MRIAWVVLVMGCGPVLPETAADGCYNVATTLCDRLATCGTLKGSTADCRADGVRACCGTSDCSRPVLRCTSGTSCCADTNCRVVAVDASVFENCDEGIREMTCGQLAAGLAPRGCGG